MPRIIVDVHNWTWFTVDRAVGRNAPNDRLDVLLVQFLLFLATKSELAVPQTLVPQTLVPRGLRVATPLFRATTRAHPKPEGQIVIDGICGDQTIGFIEYYQESMQLRNEGWGELNGQVAPLWNIATKTMARLNFQPSRLTPGTLAQSDAFPQELNNSFYFYL